MLSGRKKVKCVFRRLWGIFNECNQVQLWILQPLNEMGLCQSCIQESGSNKLLVVSRESLHLFGTEDICVQLELIRAGNFHRLKASSGIHFFPCFAVYKSKLQVVLVGVFS